MSAELDGKSEIRVTLHSRTTSILPSIIKAAGEVRHVSSKHEISVDADRLMAGVWPGVTISVIEPSPSTSWPLDEDHFLRQ